MIRNPKGILISQRHYVMSMLFKFDMADCKSISTPLDRTVKIHPDSGKSCEPKRFRQIVRSLIYLTITRPDLTYLVSLISQFMMRPTEEHLQCALNQWHYEPGVVISERYCRATSSLHGCRLGRKRRRSPIHIWIRVLSWERLDRLE